MKVEDISALYEELNISHFKRNLKIEIVDPAPWGDGNYWYVNYKSNNLDYFESESWLHNSKSFEIRHGHAGSFGWWWDNLVCNEIALRFNGVWKDDASERKIESKPNKYDSLFDFLNRLSSRIGKHAKYNLLRYTEELEFIPEEFKSDLPALNSEELEECRKQKQALVDWYNSIKGQ